MSTPRGQSQTQRFDRMSEEIKIISEQQHELSRGQDMTNGKLDKLEQLIRGSDFYKTVGLEGEISEIKQDSAKNMTKINERLDALEEFKQTIMTLKSKFIWMAAGMGVTGGIGIVKFFDWLKKIFLFH